jgi:uncharacterized membrane protein
MSRIRIGLALTFIIGSLYSAFGLFESLTKFSVGMVVACLAVIGFGLLDHLEAEHDNRILREREQVWARRDNR